MTTLADLLSELESEVPAVSGVPSEGQYTQAIKDAVNDFSRRCGLGKIASLNIVAGTATYAMPDDFMKLISMDALQGANGVIVSSDKLIAVPMDWCETWTIVNKEITFFPTPTYSMARYFKYKAAWILSGTEGSEEYADLGDNEKDIVLMKAKGICYDKLANSMASSGALKYSLGAVSVDKGSGVDEMRKKVYAAHGEYTQACEDYNGAVFMAGIQ